MKFWCRKARSHAKPCAAASYRRHWPLEESSEPSLANSKRQTSKAQSPKPRVHPMSTIKLNRIGLELQPYRGGKTTLCAGCGHNAISERIIDAFFEMGVDPRHVVKLSGIGCSSKSPAYFLGGAHGFNSVHGRMPSVATGAVLGNKQL